jgi:hypothetical protein
MILAQNRQSPVLYKRDWVDRASPLYSWWITSDSFCGTQTFSFHVDHIVTQKWENCLTGPIPVWGEGDGAGKVLWDDCRWLGWETAVGP